MLKWIYRFHYIHGIYNVKVSKHLFSSLVFYKNLKGGFMPMMMIPESIQPSIFYVTYAYFIYLHLFVLFRVVVFNFALKKIKRPLSIAYDISLFVITSIWFLYLHSQDFIYYSYDSPILLFVGFAYFVSLFDFIYNYILIKKYKV